MTSILDQKPSDTVPESAPTDALVNSTPVTGDGFQIMAQIPGSNTPSVKKPASILDEKPSKMDFLPAPGSLPDAITEAIKASDDPMGEWAKVKSSIAMAEALKIPAGTIYSNFDSYASAWLGKDRPQKEDWQAITDTWKATKLQSELAMEWSKAIDSGDWESSLRRMAELRAAMPSPDTVQRGAFATIGKNIATFISQQEYQVEQALTSDVMRVGAGAAAGVAVGSALAGAGVGTIATAPIGAAVATGILAATFQASNAATGGKLEMGAAMEQMFQAGIPPDKALPYAVGVGAINTAIESVEFGQVFGKLFSKSAAQKATEQAIQLGLSGESAQAFVDNFKRSLTDKVLDDYVKGKLVTAALGPKANPAVVKALGSAVTGVARSAIVANWEAGTEGVQQLVGDIAQNAAAEAYNKTFPNQQAQTMDSKAIIDDVANTFVTMWQGAFFTLGAARGVKTLAEHQKTIGEQQASATGKPLPEAAPAETSPDLAAVYQNPDVTPYSELKTLGDHQDENGNIRTDAILKVGDPEQQQLHAYATLSIEGDTVSVRDVALDQQDNPTPETDGETVQLPEEMAPLFQSVFSEIQRKFPGMKIELDAQDPTLQKAFDTVQAQQNTLTRAEFLRQITDNIPDPEINSKAEGLLAFADAMAKANNESTDSMLGKLFEREAIVHVGETALNQGKSDTGIQFTGADNFQTLSRANLGQVKALIKVTEGTDFTSLVHEFFHAAERLYLRDDQVKAFESALGKSRDTWGREDVEYLANQFEHYLHEGKAPTPELGNVFQRLAQALAHYLQEFTHLAARYGDRYQLTPELRQAYDSLVQESPAMAQADAQAVRGRAAPAPIAKAPGVSSDQTTTELYHQADPVDSEAFKKWFGDSKVVDTEGKPLVVYHGTPDGRFDSFDLGRRGMRTLGHVDDSRALHFVDNPETARAYSEEYMNDPVRYTVGGEEKVYDGGIKRPYAKTFEVYLSIRNPKYLDITAQSIRQAKDEGHDGIITDMGTGTEYVVFSPTQIKSVNNRGTWDGNDPRILYHSREDLMAEARKEKSFEDFKAFVEFADSLAIPGVMEGETPKGVNRDEWIRELWDEAHSKPMSKEESDAAFLKDMRKEGGVEAFLRGIWDTLSGAREYEHVGPVDAEEQAHMERLMELRSRIQTEVHPTILNNATRIGMDRPLTDRARKSILSLMREGVTDYKAIWAELSQNEEAIARSNAELAARQGKIGSLPDPRAMKLDRLSIADRIRLSKAFDNEETRKKIASGEIDAAGIKDLLASVDEENKKLEEEKATLSKELDSAYAGMSRQERRFVDLKQELKDKERELFATNRKLRDVRDRATKAREDSSLIRQWKTAQARHEGEQSASARLQPKIDSQAEKITSLEESLRAKRLEHEQSIRDIRAEQADLLKSIKSEARMNKAIAVQNAIDSLREKQQAQAEKRRALREINLHKKKLIEDIMRKPSTNTVHWDEIVQIRDIQDYVRSILQKVEDSLVIGPEDLLVAGKDSPIIGTWDPKDFARFMEENPDVSAILGKKLVTKLEKHDPKALTLADLESLAKKVEDLRTIGRRKLLTQKATEAAVRRGNQDSIISEIESKTHYVEPQPMTSEEQKKQVRKAGRVNKVATTTWDDHRLYRNLLDNMKKGINHLLLVDRPREARRQEIDAIDRRVKPLQEAMAKANVDIQKLYDTKVEIEELRPDKTTFNLAQLMFYDLALRDEDSRAAAIFGNMYTDQERQNWRDMFRYQKEHEGRVSKSALLYDGNRKLKILQEAIDANLTPELRSINDLIAADWEASYDPMAKTAIHEFNFAPPRVKHYVAMQRLVKDGDTMSLNDYLKADLEGRMGLPTLPGKGFTESRIKIAPENQGEVKDDLFSVWMDSVRRTEHFIAFTPLVRELNATYAGRTSKGVQEQIVTNFGNGVKKRINQTITELANPSQYRELTEADQAVRLLRGAYSTAVLGARLSSIVTQIITNPVPFFAYAPVQMAKNLTIMLGDPIRFLMKTETMMGDAESKSPILRALEANPVEEAIQGVKSDSKLKRGLKKAQEGSMAPMALVVRWINAAGWKSVYDKAILDGLSEDAARAKADEALLETQPSYNPSDLAPLYKNLGEVGKIITQFQVPLGTQWQQITADIPYYAKNGAIAKAIGIGVAYSMMGFLLFAAKGDHGGTDDEKWKKWIWSFFGQHFDAIPFGSVLNVTGTAQQLITGLQAPTYPKDIFPAASRIMQGFDNVSKEEYVNAIWKFLEGAGMFTGMPVQSMKDLSKVINGDLGGIIGKKPDSP